MGHFISTNGIQLHYLDHGENGPPLILMPGLSANARCFDGLVAAGLADHFRLLALDLRGRGQSDKPADGYTMANHAADVIGLLDALALEQVVLGGHSFGGLLTMYTAAHYPDRVSNLIILDAAGELHPAVRELIKPSLARLEQTAPSWDHFIKQMKAQPFLEGEWDESLENYYRADVEILPDGTVKSRSNPQAIWQAADLAIDEPWETVLTQIKQPTLMIRAPDDYGPAPVVPYENAMRTVNAIRNCRYVEARGNHMTMLFTDKAARIVEAITAFLEPN